MIGGVGFMIYRDHDDNKPTEVYDTEPIDYTYSPVFIERANVDGDLGDDTQSFHMQFTQTDWSGGLGQRYFRQTIPQESSYWDGKSVQTAALAGQVRLGWLESLQTPQGGAGTYEYLMLYHRNVDPNFTGLSQGALIRFEGTQSSTVRYDYSYDGGATWLSQGLASGIRPADIGDGVVGDDGFMYLLCNSVGGNTATIVKVGPLTSASATFDQSTQYVGTLNPQANTISHWSGNIYVGSASAQLRQATVGNVGSHTLIHDFGGWTILQLLNTPGGVYIHYARNDGSYRVYLYNGQNTRPR